MRHAIAGNRLGRNSSLRKATVRDIAKATLVHQRIRTTKAKAKEARKLVDRLITLGKKGTLAGRRKAFAILCDHKLVSQLFKTISPRFSQRAGGYTRIIPLAIGRRGDNASLALLELTEKDVSLPAESTSISKKSKAEESSQKSIEGPQDKKDGEKSKEKTPFKEQQPKTTTRKDSQKPSRKLIGGLKKIFRKKSSDKKGS